MHQKKKQRKKHHFKWWYRLTQQKKNFLFFNNLMKPNDDDDHDDNLMIMMRIVFVPGTVFFSSFNFFPLFFRNSKIWHESHTTHTYEMESTTMNFFWFYQNFVPENKWMNESISSLFFYENELNLGHTSIKFFNFLFRRFFVPGYETFWCSSFYRYSVFVIQCFSIFIFSAHTHTYNDCLMSIECGNRSQTKKNDSVK